MWWGPGAAAALYSSTFARCRGSLPTSGKTATGLPHHHVRHTNAYRKWHIPVRPTAATSANAWQRVVSVNHF